MFFVLERFPNRLERLGGPPGDGGPDGPCGVAGPGGRDLGIKGRPSLL